MPSQENKQIWPKKYTEAVLGDSPTVDYSANAILSRLHDAGFLKMPKKPREFWVLKTASKEPQIEYTLHVFNDKDSAEVEGEEWGSEVIPVKEAIDG